MLTKTKSYALLGLRGYEVNIEIDLGNGLPGVDIVGLPSLSVKESRERVRSAIRNSGFLFPAQRVTVNLAPADMPKDGALYDLPLAVGILRAGGQLQYDNLDDTILVGELSLDGQLRRMTGLMPIIISARAKGYRRILIPGANANEASYIDGIEAYGFHSLSEVVYFLSGALAKQPIEHRNLAECIGERGYAEDFRYVKGQYVAKRALEIAASGGHNVIMIGPPGAGKTMLARCLPSILPQMSVNEALETTKIHSIAGILNDDVGMVLKRPFRTPHHTSSRISLTGGGATAKPGEVSIAHNGVLFLDELLEYPRSTLEILRQPLEDKTITIARAATTVEYPANFMLIASMNPCPCGNYGSDVPCKCSPSQINKYMARLSGPLLDRIDLHLEVSSVTYDDLASTDLAEDSASISQRVERARQLQLRRFEGTDVYCNARMTSQMVRDYCALDTTSENIMKEAFQRLNLSARAYIRIIKVARTIADLDGAENIQAQHIAEAIQYRTLDRKYWE